MPCARAKVPGDRPQPCAFRLVSREIDRSQMPGTSMRAPLQGALVSKGLVPNDPAPAPSCCILHGSKRVPLATPQQCGSISSNLHNPAFSRSVHLFGLEGAQSVCRLPCISLSLFLNPSQSSKIQVWVSRLFCLFWSGSPCGCFEKSGGPHIDPN